MEPAPQPSKVSTMLGGTPEFNIKHPQSTLEAQIFNPDLHTNPWETLTLQVRNLYRAVRGRPRPRALYSQTGGVGGQWARQCPPAGRGQLPATAVQEGKAAGTGRRAQAGPGSGQQQQRLRQDEQPGEGSRPTAQAPLLADAAGRGRHLPPARARSRTAAGSERRLRRDAPRPSRHPEPRLSPVPPLRTG